MSRGSTERATAKDKALPIIDRLALAGRTLLEELATLRDVSGGLVCSGRRSPAERGSLRTNDEAVARALGQLGLLVAAI